LKTVSKFAISDTHEIFIYKSEILKKLTSVLIVLKMKMTAATATKPATAKKAMTNKSATGTQSRYASTQARFASSKLIQNLGSSNNGVQFTFVSDLRTAFGRD
tara:strand:+ start:153 stop:461 length:309 start_codon:yes stop_codon:yes gene_type:complete